MFIAMMMIFCGLIGMAYTLIISAFSLKSQNNLVRLWGCSSISHGSSKAPKTLSIYFLI